MTTEEQRKEWERLANEATPGPWRWWTSCSFRRLSSDATGRDGDVLHGSRQSDGVIDVAGSEADKAFIAASREAVPALLADLRSLREERGRAMDLLRELYLMHVADAGECESKGCQCVWCRARALSEDGGGDGGKEGG